MGTGFPLFPQQASTMAGRVDALYLFLIAISVFLARMPRYSVFGSRASSRMALSASIDSQRVQLITASAQRSVTYFGSRYQELRDAATIAGSGIAGITDFVATFKDNPGRRMISLFGGALVGLLMAWALHLDVFRTVLETPAPAQPAVLLPFVGVALTGMLMGLGANPTHEVIRILQEIKNRRKADNIL